MSTKPVDPAVLAAPSLDGLPVEQLQRMLMAAREVHECHRVLHRGGGNLVTEILRDAAEEPEIWSHYPENDVKDADSGALYYYHSHREGEEHGHFHCFVQEEDPETGRAIFVHVGAISMSAQGLPLALFATNRWVTDEYWLPAEDTIALLDRFVVDHASPSWPVNRWLSAMPILFRPHFESLLRHRDECMDRWVNEHRAENVFDDERLEVTGMIPIDVGRWLRALQGRLSPVAGGTSASAPALPRGSAVTTSTAPGAAPGV